MTVLDDRSKKKIIIIITIKIHPDLTGSQLYLFPTDFVTFYVCARACIYVFVHFFEIICILGDFFPLSSESSRFMRFPSALYIYITRREEKEEIEWKRWNLSVTLFEFFRELFLCFVFFFFAFGSDPRTRGRWKKNNIIF